MEPNGPLLVEGPVEVVRADGTVVRSDRFMVAVCTCRRTRTAPWCDTSHRCHERAARQRATSGPTRAGPRESPRGNREGSHDDDPGM